MWEKVRKGLIVVLNVMEQKKESWINTETPEQAFSFVLGSEGKWASFLAEEECNFPIILHLMGLPSQDVSQAQRQSEGERECMV